MIVETIPPTVLLVILAPVATPACRETAARSKDWIDRRWIAKFS